MVKATNGCVDVDRIMVPGTMVQVMPRSIAQAVSRRHNQLIGTRYTMTEDAALKLTGYQAKIVGTTTTIAGALLYKLHVQGRSSYVNMPASCIFGPSHFLGDVVEVGMNTTPGVPPNRRVFASYTIDSKFDPVILTYDADDTTSILDSMNSAVVDLEAAEIWDVIFPVEASLIPLPPKYDVSVAVNGTPSRVRDLTRAQWCEIYDDIVG
jgi:hypothetical protein